jgi:hypothetical protein
MRNTKSKDLVAAIDDALTEFTETERPVTVRQCYYHLVSKGLLEKTEDEYHWTSRRLTKLRENFTVPFEYIIDNTRWVRKPNTFDGLGEVLGAVVQSYRRPIWHDQESHVEIWLEKDALAGVFETVTDELDVPLLVCRGYPSITFLHAQALRLQQVEKPAFLYFFGDYDPAGQDIPRNVCEKLRGYGAEFQDELVAVTPEQIAELGLPTRPTKRGNGLARQFDAESVELDAIPPATLRDMVRVRIEQHLDVHKYTLTQEMQEVERATCTKIARAWDANPKRFVKMLNEGTPKRRRKK